MGGQVQGSDPLSWVFRPPQASATLALAGRSELLRVFLGLLGFVLSSLSLACLFGMGLTYAPSAAVLALFAYGCFYGCYKGTANSSSTPDKSLPPKQP